MNKSLISVILSSGLSLSILSLWLDASVMMSSSGDWEDWQMPMGDDSITSRPSNETRHYQAHHSNAIPKPCLSPATPHPAMHFTRTSSVSSEADLLVRQ